MLRTYQNILSGILATAMFCLAAIPALAGEGRNGPGENSLFGSLPLSDPESGGTLTGELSIAEALATALKHNISLKEVERLKLIGRGEVAAADAADAFKLSVAGSFTRLNEAHGVTFGDHFNTMGFADNYAAGLQAVKPLSRGGAIFAGKKTAHMFSRAYDEKIRLTRQHVLFATAGKYLEVVLSGHLCTIYSDALASARGHVEAVEEKFKEGLVPRFDLLRAQVEAANIKAELIQQQNRLHLAMAGFLRLLGVSQNSTVSLTDELEYETVEPTLEQAIYLALAHRPDLQMARLGFNIKKMSLTLARSTFRPEVNK